MRDRVSSFLISFSCLIFILSCAFGQTASPPEQSLNSAQTTTGKTPPIFHSESRLVVVDVVVTKHREPVTDLTQSDFQVLEDGKRQQIQFFEAHTPSTSTERQAALPEHQYSNISDETPSSINIVLFDLLNTPLTDQPYAREQMVQFLKTLPPGRQVALFELGGTLRMLAVAKRRMTSLDWRVKAP